MLNLNFKSVASFALKNHCSYVGGRPASDVLKGGNGEIIFFFSPQHSGNIFFQWIRMNFDSNEYFERELFYKNKSYQVLFLKIPQRISKKFLLNFRKFSNLAPHLLGYFNN